MQIRRPDSAKRRVTTVLYSCNPHHTPLALLPATALYSYTALFASAALSHSLPLPTRIISSPISHDSPLPRMPSFPNFSLRLLSRFLGIFRHRNIIVSGGDIDDESPAGECYACTRPGVPAFHSTSCDRSHSPEWEAGAGSSLIPIQGRRGRDGAAPKAHRSSAAAASRSFSSSSKWIFGRVLDPRSKRVQRWNRAFLLARGVSLAIDPLFFYALSIGRDGAPCLYMDGWLAAIVTALRSLTDALHLLHLWLQLRLAYVSRESLVVGCGKLVWDAQEIASHYVRSVKGFWFDAFVILPVPQVRFLLLLFSHVPA
ncbi:hypothetical protein ACLOJK_035424 [Asimina triloba]